ncbi:MAG: DUF2235 domain-containing protein [Calditrichaeota bacterium]|nr:MAG: DUF2235 domain-containing protein [Calditrichota bacterium]
MEILPTEQQEEEMAKNIILCADGTGNKGGYSPDSNVYKIYKSVDVHDDGNPQIKFYDNGIGTGNNKIWRTLSGAFGFGFKRNVCDLYLFLARNYEPGDRVYLFGFSRGAATIRAFSGFIHACGLMKNTDAHGKSISDEKIKEYMHDAYKAYKKSKSIPALARRFREHKNSHGVIDIEFIGVWDTVSALGFPEKWDITGIGVWVLNALFKSLDFITDVIFPHRFYNYELTDNVKYACHALAIDDERLSFLPKVWDETKRKEGTVEQVWFAGMHSNVGGGYARNGMANVALYWMMERAHNRQLAFKNGAIKQVYGSSHVNGRMYNSRDGLAVFYRYHPRPISQLCEKKLTGRVRIHTSVLHRLKRQTGNYAPGNLPDNFTIVGDIEGENGRPLEFSKSAEWRKNKKSANRWIVLRKWLYGISLETILFVLGTAVYFWVKPPAIPSEQSKNWLMQQISDVLEYVLPKMFDGIISFAVILHPHYFWICLIFVIILWIASKIASKKTIQLNEKMRAILLEATAKAAKEK